MIEPQSININFQQGLNQKVDPWQLPIGNFATFNNGVFDKVGLIKKRNGYTELTSLPNATYAYLTTLNGGLTAIGPSVASYIPSTSSWVPKGKTFPLKESTQPLVRNSLNQTQCDTTVTANGLACTVYSELNNSTTTYKYVIADTSNGQNIVPPTLIPAGAGVVTGAPRIFLLGQYFVIVFTNVISATSHLQYFSISSVNTSLVTTAADIASSYVSATTLSYDGVVFNNNLYVAFNTTSGGQSIKITYLTIPNVVLSQTPVAPTVFASEVCTMMSLAVDSTVNFPLVYLAYYDLASAKGKVAAVDLVLNKVLNPTQIIASGTYLNITCAAQSGSVNVFIEASNNYSYDAAIPSHFIQGISVTSGGTVGSLNTVIRSVGLASKAFIISGQIYFLSSFQSPFQPTYFLINGSSLQATPVIAAKLAYENGGGYLTTGLPSVTVYGTSAQIAYLYKDLIAALQTTNTPQQTTTGGIYAQTGINLATFDFTSSGIDAVDIGNNLHLSGGFLGMFDGFQVVEHNFFLWPDSVEVSTTAGGGTLAAATYFYQAVYAWTDSQGNVHRSAPSIPVSVVATGGSSINTVNVPTLRLTMKTDNPAQIEIYRYSNLNPVYILVTSITAPKLNSTTSDSITFSDTGAVTTGNQIYTTGGVVEDVNAPASNIMTLFDTRLWLVDAEDPNLLWFSKQVIEATPVEMSDLFTVYVAPNVGASSSTGAITGLAPMDEKLIIFKSDAIYYISGAGPDNTGANNQYSQPTFVTSIVGCSDQASIVLMNDGLMFQSDKGIWLLNRGLQVTYLGAPVDDFNDVSVNSANNIPKTNQVRSTLASGETLMYDYYVNQWGTFSGSSAISSVIYDDLHTTINQYGQVFQESPGLYLDGSNPVTMSLETGWINVASIQGYQRLYQFNLIGRYLSPHKLYIRVAYDYNETPLHSRVIIPKNYSPAAASPFGEQPAPFGSPIDLEQWAVPAKRGNCQAFKIFIDEIYDPSFGTVAGPGLTLSGINMVVGIKRQTRPIKAANTAGVR